MIELAQEFGYNGSADDRRRRPGHLVQPRRQAQRPRALPRDVRPHGRRHAGPRRDRAGRLRVRPGPRRRRRRVRRGAIRPGAQHREGAHARRGDGGGARRVPARVGRHRPHDLRDRLGDAHRRAVARDRRARRALPRRRRRRVRHRRRRGRLPAVAPPRRVPVRQPRELPLHDPRRRGVRPAVDLGGGAVLRRRAAGPRRPDRRRHRPRSTASAREQLGRLATYIRDRRIPLELCPTSNVNTGVVPVDRRPSDRHAAPAAVPRHGQHRQPPDEQHVDDQGDAEAAPKRSAGVSTTSSGSRSTR